MFEEVTLPLCLQGDAIAFVLGSTRQNISNKALQSCITDSLHGDRTAQTARVSCDSVGFQYAWQLNIVELIQSVGSLRSDCG